MKKTSVSLGLMLMIAGVHTPTPTFAHGGPGGGGFHGGGGYHGGGYYGGYHGGYWGGYYGPRYYGGCSPEMKQNSVSVAERVLNETAKSPDFDSATQFKEFVSSAEKIQDADEKLHTYFSVMGVDSRNAEAIAEFVGSRDHTIYKANAEKALGLSPAQSELLVNRFTKEALDGLTE